MRRAGAVYDGPARTWLRRGTGRLAVLVVLLLAAGCGPSAATPPSGAAAPSFRPGFLAPEVTVSARLYPAGSPCSSGPTPACDALWQQVGISPPPGDGVLTGIPTTVGVGQGLGPNAATAMAPPVIRWIALTAVAERQGSEALLQAVQPYRVPTVLDAALRNGGHVTPPACAFPSAIKLTLLSAQQQQAVVSAGFSAASATAAVLIMPPCPDLVANYPNGISQPLAGTAVAASVRVLVTGTAGTAGITDGVWVENGVVPCTGVLAVVCS